MDEQSPLPRWFCAVFAAVMLALVAELFWYVPEHSRLQFQLSDLSLSLETSRQREAKQQYEYDQVVLDLPLTQAELAELQPLSDAAQAREQELRQTRKALRAQKADLALQLENALASSTDLQSTRDTLQGEVDALHAQVNALQQQVSELRSQLGHSN